MSDNPNAYETRDVANAATPYGEPVMPPHRPSSASEDIRAEAVNHDDEVARAPVDMKEVAAKGSDQPQKKDGISSKTAKKQTAKNGKNSKAKK